MSIAPSADWYVYMIRCQNDSLYTGMTNDIDRRFGEHQSQGKKCAKYLRGKGPLQLVYVKTASSKPEALKEEMRLKSLKKVQKETLITQAS